MPNSETHLLWIQLHYHEYTTLPDKVHSVADEACSSRLLRVVFSRCLEAERLEAVKLRNMFIQRLSGGVREDAELRGKASPQLLNT